MEQPQIPQELSQLLLRSRLNLESPSLCTCCMALQSLGMDSSWAGRLRLGAVGAKHVKCSTPTQMSGWAPLAKSCGKEVYRSRNSHMGWVSSCQELWSRRTLASARENTMIAWLAVAWQMKTSKPTRNCWGNDIGESNSLHFQRASRRGRKQGTVITRKVREIIKHWRKLFLYYGQN